RAVNSPFVNDESETFLFFIQPGDFIPWISEHWVANNHFLNSAFSWVSYRLFGLDEWSLRLPGLLSFAVLALYLYRVGNFVKNAGLRWVMWLSILGAHYFIEFYAYCRGYGISNAFLLASVFHLIRYNSDPVRRKRDVWYSFLFITGALFANLGMLFSFIIWLTLVYLIRLIRTKRWFPPLVFWLALLPLAYSLSIAFELRVRDQLYIGTPFGMESAYKILLDTMLGGRVIPALYYAYFSGILGCVLTVMAIHRSGKRQISSQQQVHLLFLLFIGLNLLISFLAHLIMDVRLPIARTTLHWYLLFLITLILTMDLFVEQKRGWLIWLWALPLLFMPWRFIEVANLRVSSDPGWAREQIPDSFYNYVAGDSSAFPPTISAGLNFYSHNWSLIHLQKQQEVNVCQSYVDKEFVSDYQIVNLTDSPEFRELYTEELFDTYSELSLIKRKEFLKKELVYSSGADLFENGKPSFHEIIAQDSVHALQGENIRMDYTLNLETDDHPFTGLVTFGLKNENGDVLAYKQVNLDHHKNHWCGKPFRFSIYF
ncbi:MAG: hypothetical protein ACPF9D_12155, partial [Owenweeksia sp.]